jgi:hypothetical protein
MDEFISVPHQVAFRALRGASLHAYLGKATADLVPHLQRISASPLLKPHAVTLLYINPRSARDGPEDAYRKAAALLQQQLATQTLAEAIVIPAQGFVGATARAVMGAQGILHGTRTPSRVFTTLEEAAQWAQQTAPQLQLRVPDLVDAIQQLVVALGKRT